MAYTRRTDLMAEDEFLAYIRDYLESNSSASKSGCILWGGAKTKCGYGYAHMRRLGGESRAHRIAWIVKNGAIDDGLQVLHLCDNRICINTDHLFLGTGQDNMTDMRAKSRQGRTKLTWAGAAQIRSDYSSGLTQNCIANKYRVSQGTVSRVLRNAGWRIDFIVDGHMTGKKTVGYNGRVAC